MSNANDHSVSRKIRTRKSEIIALVVGLPTLFAVWRVDKHIDEIVQVRTEPIERAIASVRSEYAAAIDQTRKDVALALDLERQRAQERERSIETEMRELRVVVMRIFERIGRR